MDERLAHAAALAEHGELQAARQMVLNILEDDRANFEAWHALSQLARDDKERRNAIYKMWGLRPDDPDANMLLDKLKAGSLPPLDDDAENFSSRKYKASAEIKSYRSYAYLTLVFYFFFWIFGIIANIYFLFDVHQQTKRGIQTENVGCLWAMLIFGSIMPILGVILGFFMIVFIMGVG